MSAYSPNAKADHLLRLSSEVSRIAGTLARLSGNASESVEEAAPDSDLPEVPVERIHNIIRARRMRGRFLPDELFADPAWDMLLDLLRAEILQQRVIVSSLCIAASVPATTALRWLTTLVNRGLVVRFPDPMDARKAFVELAPETSVALRRYFAAIGDAATV